MKQSVIFLLVFLCFCNCSSKKQTLEFTTLDTAQFNSSPFKAYNGKMVDSLKQAHDSCMGFSFDFNAFFGEKRDSFFFGSIVNRQSLKVVNTISDLGVSMPQLISDFNIISKPCYEKRALQFPLKLLLGPNFTLQFPNADEAVNKEINDAISTSDETIMQTGSWVYLDVKYALKNILDTARNEKLLNYKNNLLDTSNMLLAAGESMTDISFIISSRKELSEALQTFLRNKPSSKSNSLASLQLTLLDSNRFQIYFNGFFPVIGAFMKAELK